jgi:hypothetical protein
MVIRRPNLYDFCARISQRWPSLILIGLSAALLSILQAGPSARATIAAAAGKVSSAGDGIAGSTVTLFAANETSASQLGTTITDSQGLFSLPFTNPGGNSVLYIVAKGGDVGRGSNSAITLATVLGTASNYAPSVAINELTTIASIWSLTQFIHSDGSIYGPSPGLQDGAATVPSLVNLSNGSPSRTLTSGWNQPTKLVTLGNMLASCVQSAGASSSECGDLFQNAVPPKGTAPGDVLTAATDIAINPGLNVGHLFDIAHLNQSYGTGLAAAPSAWTLTIQYQGGGMDGPLDLAIDREGNVWVANWDGFAGVSKIKPGGTPDSSSPFQSDGNKPAAAIAVDQLDNVWTANIDGTVSELSSDGTLISPGSGYPTCAQCDVRDLTDIAIDPAGSVWSTVYGAASYVAELNSTGQIVSQGYGGGGIYEPVSMAIDGNGIVWIANDFSIFSHPKHGTISAFKPSGKPLSPKRGFHHGIASPVSIAIGPKGEVWIANVGYKEGTKYNPGEVVKLNSHGATASPGRGYRGGGIFQPWAIAPDGAGHVWVLGDNDDSAPCRISELASNGKPITPETTGYLLDQDCDSLHGLAIDSAGNLWIPNTGLSTLIEVIGIASPVKTPVIGAVQSP